MFSSMPNPPVEYNPHLFENDPNPLVKSVFARMAGFALDLYEDTGEEACVFKIFEKDQTAMWMSNQIRKKPPVQWPPGLWEVVGRRNQVFRDGQFHYTSGSRLAITIKGTLPNECAYVFQHPVMGRPKRDLQAAINQHVTWSFQAHADPELPVVVPAHNVCPVCGKHALSEEIIDGLQVVTCTRTGCDPMLIRAKLPISWPSESQRV